MSNYSGLLRKQILINITNSIRNIDMIIIEDKLINFQKSQMNEVKKRLRGAEKEMCAFTPREFMKVIEDEVLENWESSSYQNITMMASSMSIEQRRLYEEVAGHILAGTFKVEEE